MESLRYTLNIAYFIALIFATAVAVFRWNKADTVLIPLLVLMPLTLGCELLHNYLIKITDLKNIVYHILNPIELFFITVYFAYSILPKHKKAIIYLSMVGYPTLAILNALFLQNLRFINSNFSALESFIGILMAIYAFYTFLVDDEIDRISEYSHFLIWAVLFIYFSETFSFWAFVRYLYQYHPAIYLIALNLHLFINTITYGSLAVIFLNSKRTHK